MGFGDSVFLFSPEEFIRRLRSTQKSQLDRFFVKSNDYKNENEWRMIIDGLETHLPPNDDGI